MKHYSKLLSLAIAICMVISLLPTFVSATEISDSFNIPIGVGLRAVQNRNTVVFSGDEWIVLDNTSTTFGSAGLALISKNIVDANIAFNESGLDNTWANSDAKSWLADYASNNFTSDELAVIVDTTKAETAGEFFGHAWSKDALNAEKFFFLSAAEVEQYFIQGSLTGLIATYDDVADGWWLRSAYTDRDIMGGIVSDAGYVGYPHVAATWGARPAFNIAGASIALSSAAVGGKISGEVGANSLTEIAASTSSSIKLTILDDVHKEFSATIADGTGTIQQTIGYDTWTIPVNFSGAVEGENEYVSVLICDQTGNSVYYGHIANNTTSGNVDMVMPRGLSGKYTIYVFAEQCNGDYATDYSSALVSSTIEISDNMSKVDSWGLALQGDIYANFQMKFSESVLSDPDAYVTVTLEDKQTSYKISDLTANEDGLFVITTSVAAPQMTDVINIQTFANDIAGSVYKYSVRGYGDYILENSEDENVINLVKSMLNYGGKSQEYFAYNIENKADNGININNISIPKYENLTAKKEGSSSNVRYYGASLIHEHQTGIRFYFTSTDEQIQSVSFTAVLADGSKIENMDVFKLNGRYYVEIMNIAPNKLCNEITITVDGLSVTYSPFYYIHRMYYKTGSTIQMREMMAAMYTYYHYALVYLDV